MKTGKLRFVIDKISIHLTKEEEEKEVKPIHMSSQRFVLYIILALVMIMVSAVVAPRPAYAQSTLVVDDDGQSSATDCDAAQGAFGSIQEAIEVASSGDTIFICPGTYNEQVVVTISDLTIVGSGVGQTILQPSVVSVNSTGALDPFPMAPILLIDDTTGVTVKDLTIDGSLADEGAAIVLPCLDVGYYTGIFFRHSSGTVDATHVTNIRSATACTAGFSGGSDFESVANLIVKNSLFDNYGSLGLNCVGPNTTCSVTGNTFKGLGPVDEQIQAGIIFRLGAGGEISGNTIKDHFYTPAVGIFEFSVGIALFNAEPHLNPHLLQNNFFSGNQLKIQRQGTAAAFE
jgi:hypothetical protein